MLLGKLGNLKCSSGRERERENTQLCLLPSLFPCSIRKLGLHQENQSYCQENPLQHSEIHSDSLVPFIGSIVLLWRFRVPMTSRSFAQTPLQFTKLLTRTKHQIPSVSCLVTRVRNHLRQVHSHHSRSPGFLGSEWSQHRCWSNSGRTSWVIPVPDPKLMV